MTNIIKSRVSIDRESKEEFAFEDYTISAVLVRAYFLIRANPAVRFSCITIMCVHVVNGNGILNGKLNFKMFLK